ncbi:MAG: hypothetical protein K2N29_04035 [Ruminiclostridium sp.]|nr:hypothetical protein [Ruminiclostridium sp.]
MEAIYIGFKGERNSAYQTVSRLSGDKLFLTNSIGGLTREIAALDKPHKTAVLFGLDKRIKSGVRIESCAVKNGEFLFSALDITSVAEKLRRNGVESVTGKSPFPSLCNEAYWLALEKYGGNAVFLHLPSIRRMTEEMMIGIRNALE